jgi:hypothetical protein
LLFPKVLIDSWLLDHAEGVPIHPAIPYVIAGSHDPLLEWAVREAGSELAILFDGSLAGLERLAQRRAVASGLHVIDPDTRSYNVPQVLAWGSASRRSRDSSTSASSH